MTSQRNDAFHRPKSPLVKEVSAFICVTPLQSFIAMQLIRRKRITDYVAVNINAHDNERTRSYFSKLAANSLESRYVLLDSGIYQNYFKVRGAVNSWKQYNISSIYLASIDTVFAQHIVSNHQLAKIYTFDDGSVNIVQSSILHEKSPLAAQQRIAYFFLRGHKDQDWIKSRIVRHFTLYENMPNIVEPERVEFIDLFGEHENMEREMLSERVKVFLGFDAASTYYSAVKYIAPDIYIPHPMEKRDQKWINYVSTDLLAEHYLSHLLERYVTIDLYACKSSALLNVINPRIRKFVVDLYGNQSQWQRDYNKLAMQMGCEILDFPLIAKHAHTFAR